MAHAASTTVERGAFELKLPEPFQVVAEHTIDLPSKRKALVFGTKVWTDEWDDATGKCAKKHVDGWRVIVVTRTGKVVASRYDREQYGQTFTDPLLLGLYIQSVVQELLKVKKVQTTETEPDDE